MFSGESLLKLFVSLFNFLQLIMGKNSGQLIFWKYLNIVDVDYYIVGMVVMMFRDFGGVVDLELRVYGMVNVCVVDMFVILFYFSGYFVVMLYVVVEWVVDIIRCLLFYVVQLCGLINNCGWWKIVQVVWFYQVILYFIVINIQVFGLVKRLGYGQSWCICVNNNVELWLSMS